MQATPRRRRRQAVSALCPTLQAAAARAGTRTPMRHRQALIVGAGLAGCATAWALAEQGWRSTLIDRHDAPAQEASGNLAGLFHGIVNPQDGAHARFNRAAALEAQRAVRFAIDSGTASRGSTDGLLRLETSGRTVVQALRDDAGAPVAARRTTHRRSMPAPASQRCGLPVQHPAWFYPGGGWVQPAGLARSFLRRAGAMSEFRRLAAVQPFARARRCGICSMRSGRSSTAAATLILANAIDALRLLGRRTGRCSSVRGQVSLLDQADTRTRLRLPAPTCRWPATATCCPRSTAVLLFGATSQAGDADPPVRDADHAHNLQRLQRLSPHRCRALANRAAARPRRLALRQRRPPAAGRRGAGRSGGRDRAAWNAWTDAAAARAVRVQRHWARAASAGPRWARQVLAALISGAPVPLESSAWWMPSTRRALRCAPRAAPCRAADRRRAQLRPCRALAGALCCGARRLDARRASRRLSGPVFRSAFSFSFSSFFFFLASSRWRFSNE